MKNSQFDVPVYKSALLLIFLIGLVYSNSFDCTWHLDDYNNIVGNKHVEVERLNWDSIKNSFFAAHKTVISDRPLVFFTFALNWYWGQGNVRGYHIFNIALHTITAFFLFLTILLLFQTPKTRGWDKNSIYFAALFSASLWAVHPIQTQAVTYIVQRMASMAALFYIISIYCYLKARLTSSGSYQFLFLGLSGLAFLFGLASKENVILLPVFLLLVEIVFFQDLRQKRTQKFVFAFFFGGTILALAFGFYYFVNGKLFLIFEGYESRPFSLFQRLLTQPSVLLFYLSQILYPIADRFSIAHDFSVSTSLFAPWTTLPAILITLCLIGLALWRINKNPIFAFALLFFFGNHLIESTIIPLEMVFEHRNYLPSLFLFVPVSIGIKKAIDHYSFTQKTMFFFLIMSVCAVMVALGMSTYIRNWDWRTSKSLWTDAIEKSPNSGRPLHNLAFGHYERIGQIDRAIEAYQKALLLQYDRKEFKADTYNNLAAINYSKLQNYEKAVEYAKKAIEILPKHNKANLLLCYALGKLTRYEEALLHLDYLIAQYPGNADFLYLKGLILLQTLKYEKAWESFNACLQQSPRKLRYMRELGHSLTRMQYYSRGHWFLKLAESQKPNQKGLLLCLAENRIMAGNPDEAMVYIDRLIESVGIENIEALLIENSEDRLGLPFFYKEIVPLVSQNIMDRSEECSKVSERLLKQFVPGQ